MSDRDRKPNSGAAAARQPTGAIHRRRLARARREPGRIRSSWYGWHTVAAALATRGAASASVAFRKRRARLPTTHRYPRTPEIVRPSLIDQRLGPMPCTRACWRKPIPCPRPDIDTLAQDGIVLVLDQITDPHNVGAIMRSRRRSRSRPIVTTARQARSDRVLAKAASGALELVRWSRCKIWRARYRVERPGS